MKPAILILSSLVLAGCQFTGVREWSIEVQAPGASVKIGAKVDGKYEKLPEAKP